MLGVSRSGYYEWNRSGKKRHKLKQLREQELLAQIRRIHKASHGIFGYRKITFKLKDAGIPCTGKRVLKVMSKYGIRSRVVRKYKPQTTKADPTHGVFENLLGQNFTVSAPNQVWVSDITYIRVGDSWMYLAIVLDLFTRCPVGWALSKHPMPSSFAGRSRVPARKRIRPMA
jgi:putative transposase